MHDVGRGQTSRVSWQSPLLDSADALLFDLDGVLIDSRVPFARCINEALIAHRLPARPEHEVHRLLGPPLHNVFAELGAGELVQSCVDSYRARYQTLAATTTSVVPGIRTVLATLAPQLPMLVATSKPRALAVPVLAALELCEFFQAVIGPDLAAEGETKAITIARALRHLPGSREPVMIGDRKFDMLGANQHGLATIGVLWGIGDAQELLNAGARAIATTPDDLLVILAGSTRT